MSTRLDGTLRVVNDGNAPAVLIARMAGNGPGGSYWLRSILKHGNLQNVTEDQLMDYGRDYLKNVIGRSNCQCSRCRKRRNRRAAELRLKRLRKAARLAKARAAKRRSKKR